MPAEKKNEMRIRKENKSIYRNSKFHVPQDKGSESRAGPKHLC